MRLPRCARNDTFNPSYLLRLPRTRNDTFNPSYLLRLPRTARNDTFNPFHILRFPCTARNDRLFSSLSFFSGFFEFFYFFHEFGYNLLLFQLPKDIPLLEQHTNALAAGQSNIRFSGLTGAVDHTAHDCQLNITLD